MALTSEESRALAYNLMLKRREIACKSRDYLLKGNDALKKGLIDRTQAVLLEESSEQQQKVRYEDREWCESQAVNG